MAASRSLAQPFLSLGPLVNTVRCSRFPLSSRLKGVPVPLRRLPLGSPPLPPLTQTLRSPCSKMGWVHSSKISPHFLIYLQPDGPPLFLTSCLVRAAPCMGISSFLPRRRHISDLLIGAIKR